MGKGDLCATAMPRLPLAIDLNLAVEFARPQLVGIVLLEISIGIQEHFHQVSTWREALLLNNLAGPL